MMINEKNQGDLFQNFLWATRKGDVSRGAKDKNSLTKASADDVKNDASQAATHLRTLITLFATNSEARKLLSDFGFVARDMFATGAAKAADKARPPQDKMDQVDKPAPSGEWVSADGKRVGRDETPELQVKGPNGAEFRANPKDDPRDAMVRGTDGKERSAGQAANEASEKYNQAKSEGRSQANQAENEAQNRTGGAGNLKQQAMHGAMGHAKDVAHSDDPMGTAQRKKDDAKYHAHRAADEADSRAGEHGQPRNAQDAKNRVKESIPDEHREKMSQGIEEGKDVVNQSFPPERREQFIYRLKKVIVDCQEHKDYQEAMSFFLDKAENYKTEAARASGQGADSANKVAEDPAFNSASLQFRVLLERFANGQSMQPLWDAIDQMYTDAANDQGLRHWWSRLNDYIHKALLEPGFILEDDAEREGKQIKEDGRQYFEQKYKPAFRTLGQETSHFFGAMGDDPLNQRFGEDWKRLTKDLLFDAEGNLAYKPKLLNDIRRVILPSLLSNIGHIPIPRAEYSDEKIDLVIENLVLQGSNLAPNVVEVASNNHFKFSPYDSIPDAQHHIVTIGLSQIQADLRDVIFQFRRKSGWPKIKDAGVADVLIGGRGISVKITLETNHRRDSTFSVKDIDVDIDTLKFAIRDSHHDLLYKFVKTVATNTIRKAVEAGIHGALRTGLEHLDDQVTEVRNRIKAAKENENTSTTEELKKIYRQKKQGTKENAHKADEKTGTFKIVTGESFCLEYKTQLRETKTDVFLSLFLAQTVKTPLSPTLMTTRLISLMPSEPLPSRTALARATTGSLPSLVLSEVAPSTTLPTLASSTLVTRLARPAPNSLLNSISNSNSLGPPPLPSKALPPVLFPPRVTKCLPVDTLPELNSQSHPVQWAPPR